MFFDDENDFEVKSNEEEEAILSDRSVKRTGNYLVANCKSAQSLSKRSNQLSFRPHNEGAKVSAKEATQGLPQEYSPEYKYEEDF